ncbi:diacylglycerol kinase family protein [Paenibacillus sediminis]|uniref:Undecaprenol kinase n=1 Tax=Paenibacillus sediminis TaxID=664909 RepID=A0ABS4GYR4_9BACL|nr:diacylglycerol kinase family protein [Paenibacillus sediminis]MBP1935403.1 undecaprenol kinase [Paenibacillus sediminis]
MSRKSWISTFGHAFEGIWYSMKTQRNLRVHLIMAVLVIGAAAFFHISWGEWLVLLLTISVVIAAELMNTAVESAMDLISPNPHPLAKIAKDTAAGAVLVTAIFAVLIGIIIFYKPVFIWFGWMNS